MIPQTIEEKCESLKNKAKQMGQPEKWLAHFSMTPIFLSVNNQDGRMQVLSPYACSQEHIARLGFTISFNACINRAQPYRYTYSDSSSVLAYVFFSGYFEYLNTKELG